MLTAITRAVSPTIIDCELTYLERQPIDFQKAVEQHRNYEERLKAAGIKVISLAAEPDHPDAVFVEDAAVVVDELAVITNMGSTRRRSETASIISALSQYRPLCFLKEPVRLDGGDVLRIDRTLYVGLSSRTNEAAITQLRQLLRHLEYEVKTVKVNGCLHLKTGCTFIGRKTILANPDWVDANQFQGFEILNVASTEIWAANVLLIGDTVLFPDGFPQTADMLKERGFNIEMIDISELSKAEAGLTCLSLIFKEN